MRAPRGGTPRECRKHVQRGLQLRIKRLVHVPRSAWIVPYFAIDELSPLASTLNLFRRNILRWSGNCQGFVYPEFMLAPTRLEVRRLNGARTSAAFGRALGEAEAGSPHSA